ncbi:MAG: hypothetical protein U9P82_03920 [Bacteroidota bacterium]|nr:hypothetical protein [Bacteroidota bacterium]
MYGFHTIRTIARFEIKTLFRSWFFRIFAGLSIIALGIFNIAVFNINSGAPWIFRALPASIPYANLIILNLGQAIVAVFLASAFLKQDKKNDTVEVIYARSMTNAQYIAGKSLGILTIFILLNFIILLVGIGFSFLTTDSAKSVLDFFLYPLLISIPTLVFIFGLSFFTMTLLKNQAITFILLLGYIALTVFYLNQKYYHLFDFIAYQVPMMNSTIAGFGNLTEIIIHRSIYFLIGIGLILFTIFKLNRLPQSKKLTSLPLFLAILFIAAGIFLGYRYINLKQRNVDQKKQMIALNNQYADYPSVYIEKCTIELEHMHETISATAQLKIKNKTNKPIDTLLFSLNPSLKIDALRINNEDYTFTRNYHLVKIPYSKMLPPESALDISFTYKGSINENTHFLDKDPEEFSDNFVLNMYMVRKRFAYIEKDFVCLTRESLWYPVSGVTYSTQKPAYYQPNFTIFSLKVKTTPKLTAVSQGNVTETDNGIFSFKNTQPLPQISLLIADYKKYSVQVDSIEYAIYTTKGNDYYSEHFTAIEDTLPAIIRDIKNEFETLLDLNYHFQRFAFAEVPVHFALDKHIWSVTSDAVQPGIIFYPEKGVIMEETDFKHRIRRQEKRMKNNNEEISPEELQIRILKRFLRGNLMASHSEWYQFGNVVDRYTYNLIPNYYSFITHLNSAKYPVLNLAMEIYLKDRNANKFSTNPWFWRGISKGEKINLELKEYSLKELLEKGIQTKNDDEDPITINDIVLAKGDYLFSLLKARFGEDNFNNMLNKIIHKNLHRPFSLNDFEQEVINHFQDTLKDEVNQWYTQKQLPGYLIKDVETYKVLDGEHTKYQIRFKIANPKNTDGIITLAVQAEDNNNRRRGSNETEDLAYSNKIFIPAQSAKEVGIVFSSEPGRMNINTNISENLPNNLVYEFSGFEDVRKVAMLDEITNYPLFTDLSNPNEIIVDNEDEAFEIIQQTNESYLRTLLFKNKQERYKYSGIHFWNPPSVWEPILHSDFYGKYVRSGFYTRSGEGKRLVRWNADLPAPGYYDVYCYILKFNVQWGRQKRKPNYHFTIYHDDGMDEIVLQDGELDEGWNYIGTFYISPENAKVELNNQSVGKMVFADAIRWVKNE